MKCLNCGNELPDSALFCDNCGQEAQNSRPTEKSFCGNCGSEIEVGAEFCGNCGSPIYKRDITSENKTPDNTPKKKNSLAIAVIVLSAVIIVLISTIVGYIIHSGYSKNEQNDSNATENELVESTHKTSNTPTPSTIPQNTDVPALDNPLSATEDNSSTQNGTINSKRADLYNSSLTYKRMPEIHNTTLADDSTYYELKSVIEAFDTQCAAYMNGTTTAVPSYLLEGSKAYSQQVEYKQKHPTLNQSYQQIDVVNARQGGGYYYVWVTEVLNVNENGTAQTSTDHWVYKIENNNGHWYICDYTSDPAF